MSSASALADGRWDLGCGSSALGRGFPWSVSFKLSVAPEVSADPDVHLSKGPSCQRAPLRGWSQARSTGWTCDALFWVRLFHKMSNIYLRGAADSVPFSSRLVTSVETTWTSWMGSRRGP